MTSAEAPAATAASGSFTVPSKAHDGGSSDGLSQPACEPMRSAPEARTAPRRCVHEERGSYMAGLTRSPLRASYPRRPRRRRAHRRRKPMADAKTPTVHADPNGELAIVLHPLLLS